MAPYHRDDTRQSHGEGDEDYPRRERYYEEEEEYHFRGASNRARGDRHDFSRDRPRRQYYDRDASDDRPSQQHYSSSSDHRHSRGWSERDHVVREPTPPPQRPNGDDNIASKTAPPSQVLLIRRLKTSSNRQVLIKGINKKLCREGEVSEDGNVLGAAPGSLRGVYFICDRHDETCLSFAFAEFHSVADAKAALRKAIDLGDLCTVSSQRFLVDYANLNALPVSDNNEHPDFIFQLAEDIPVKLHRKYRDPHYYASFEPVNIDPPPGYRVRTEEEVASKPKSGPGPTMPPPPGPSKDFNFSLKKKRANESQGKDKSAQPKTKKSKTESTLGPQFATWTRKQAELRADLEASETDSTHRRASDDTAAPNQSFLCKVIVRSTHKDKTGPAAAKEKRKAGTKLAICFLCSTRLPLRHAQAHVRGCRKHLNRLQDASSLDRAYATMTKLHVLAKKTIPIAPKKSKPRYVDRAKLRRQQEKRERQKLRKLAKAAPAFKMSLNTGAGNLTSGIGARLLKKQGWTEGAGRASAPVLQNMFAAGVGLGHRDSDQGDALTHADRATRGEGSSFVTKTMESARQRFHDLSRK